MQLRGPRLLAQQGSHQHHMHLPAHPAAAMQCQRGASCSANRPRQPGASSTSGGRPSRQSSTAVRAAAVEDEDLMQFPDRYKWYEAKFAADDMPDWNPGQFEAMEQAAPGVRLLRFQAEVSRERVPLRNAYKAAGQQAVIRINGGVAHRLPVASAPFPEDLNQHEFFLLRGDIFAGETKSAREPTSVQAVVDVLVDKEAAPEVYNMRPDDMITVGPFEGVGLDLRSSGVLGLFRFPTIVMFASGSSGIAAAAALIESPHGVSTHLSPRLRTTVRLYYYAPNRASLCLVERFERWEEEYGVQVVPTTSGFLDAWDGDDTLVYEPDMTAAFVLTGDDEEAEAAALEVCREAEITAVVRQSAPAVPPVFLDSTPKSFLRWRKSAEERAAEAAAAAGAAVSTDLTD